MKFRKVLEFLLFLLMYGGVAAIVIGAVVMPYMYARVYPDSELAQKGQLSLVQTLVAQNRAQPNSKGLIILPNALDSGYLAIGMPFKNNSSGYGWVIANPVGGEKVKYGPPNTPFIFTQRDLQRVVDMYNIEPEVLEFLKANLTEEDHKNE